MTSYSPLILGSVLLLIAMHLPNTWYGAWPVVLVAGLFWTIGIDQAIREWKEWSKWDKKRNELTERKDS